MQAFLARIAPAVRVPVLGPEDIPAARQRLHEIQASLQSLEKASGRNRRWWQLRVREVEIEMLRLNYGRVFSLAAELLSAGANLDARSRMVVESDVLRCCIETLPLAQIREGMDLVFARECYGENGPALHLACLIRALLARRRGDLRLAEEFFHLAWDACGRGWCEPFGFVEIITGCAEHAFLRGAREEHAGWLAQLEHHHRGFACDDFRVRFCRILALQLDRAFPGYDTSVVNECERALASLETMAERAQYWDTARELIYLMAESGAADRAAAWQHLIPARHEFEQQLWRVDYDWYLRFQEQGLPPPSLHPYPGVAPAKSCAGNLAPALRAKLAAGYRAIAGAAANEDARLESRWRSEMIQARIAQLGRHS